MGYRILNTKIPEGREVVGLRYGAHVTTNRGAGYWIRPAANDGEGASAICLLTPNADALEGDDEEILAAIVDELWPDDD